MLALVLDGSPKLVHDYPMPAPAAGEALVKVRLAGVCDTDLQLARGYMNFHGVLGHEFVGEVAAGDANWVGRRVVADINAGCGRCSDCREHLGHHCRQRSVLGIAGRDGALAEYVCVPERCLVAVPDAVADTDAVFAEPLAAALHVLDELDTTQRRVAVLGDGKLGLLIAMSLAGAGVEVVLLGHHEKKLALARAAGVETWLVKDVEAPTELFAYVIEATGSPLGLSEALRRVAPRGTLILKTTTAAPANLDLAAIVVNELRVVGSRCGDLRQALQALQQKRVDPSPLIEARFPLARADQALSYAANKGILKVLVDPALAE